MPQGIRTMKANPFEKYLTKEQREHIRVCDWLRWVKPGLWHHYPAEGKKTPFERFLWAKMGGKSSVSDFMFYDPRHGFSGLAVELKATGETVYNKNGSIRADKVDQEKFLQDLRDRGWKATFAVGFDEAHKIISEYYSI